MTDSTHDTRHPKVRPAHLGRVAVVYVRQSTPGQTERNLESTERQYALVERAVELGWPRRAVEVIDEDLGVSGSAGTGSSSLRRAGSKACRGSPSGPLRTWRSTRHPHRRPPRLALTFW